MSKTDPLAAAIVAGGIVALISSALGFLSALALHRRDARSHARELRLALAAEIEENIARIGTLEGGRAPRRVVRSAWDSARVLELSADTFTAIVDAYAAGDDLNSRSEIIDALLGRGAYADPNSDWNRQAAAHHKAQSDELERTRVLARAAFTKARDALRMLKVP